MDKFDFRFVGWYSDGQHSDKVWGWFIYLGKVYNFWGRRGSEGKPKDIKFKCHGVETQKLTNLQREKMGKGYKGLDTSKVDDLGVPESIEKIYPGFGEHLKKQLFFAKLSGRVKGETA